MPPEGYVNRWNLEGSPQPFIVKNFRSFGFVFPADPAGIRALCQRQLNEPAGESDLYRPIRGVPLVWVTFGTAERMMSSEPPYDRFGFSPETELTFWIPVWAPSGHIAWFAPYMFVDNPLAIAQGREIYGFPKELATFRPARTPQALSRLEVDAFAAKELRSDSEWQMQTVVAIDGAHGPDPSEAARWKTCDAVGDALAAQAAGAAAVETALEALSRFTGGFFPWPPRGTLVLLKQTPSVVRGSDTSYQAIVEAGVKVPEVHRGWILSSPLTPEHRFTLHLPAMQSHPIAKDLGLADGVEALLAFRLDFDFTLEVGRETWVKHGAAASFPAGGPSLWFRDVVQALWTPGILAQGVFSWVEAALLGRGRRQPPASHPRSRHRPTPVWRPPQLDDPPARSLAKRTRRARPLRRRRAPSAAPAPQRTNE